jgi:hypothetical protein
MIPSGREGIGEMGKDGLSIMVDKGYLPMHRNSCPNHPSSKSIANALMPQAHPQDGHLSGKVSYHLIGDPCLLRSARARGYNNVAGREIFYLLHIYLIIAVDLWLKSQLSNILSQIVYKGIVVINYQYHRNRPTSSSCSIIIKAFILKEEYFERAIE